VQGSMGSNPFSSTTLNERHNVRPYRPNVNGLSDIEDKMNMKSEIGECVFVLSRKRWGRTLVGNRLRSRSWWENKLTELINITDIVEIQTNIGNHIDNPISFEEEMGLDSSLSEYWLNWLTTAYKTLEERKKQNECKTTT
jgi:hypothetical protein